MREALFGWKAALVVYPVTVVIVAFFFNVQPYPEGGEDEADEEDDSSR